jgi:hypothetical protein
VVPQIARSIASRCGTESSMCQGIFEQRLRPMLAEPCRYRDILSSRRVGLCPSSPSGLSVGKVSHCQTMVSRVGCIVAISASKSFSLGTSTMITTAEPSISNTMNRAFSPGPRL